MIVRVIPAGDLALSETGDLVWLTGPAYIRQRISARLKFFLGEWFLDRRLGVPYFKHVFVKNPNMDTVRQVFRRVIAGTPGVLALNVLTVDYDPTARSLAVGFEATVEDGVIRVTSGDPDFIIALEGT